MTSSAARKPRPARNLFQPEAKPLDSGVTPLLALRRPRRVTRSVAVLVAGLALAGICPAQDTNALPELPVATNHAELEAIVERGAASLAEQMLQTNDTAATDLSVDTNGAPALKVAAAERRYSTRNGDNNNSRRSSGDRDWRRDRRDSESRRSYGGTPAGTSSNVISASPQGPGKNVEDFSAFTLIGDRNIFNPNRYRRGGSTEPRPRPAVVDSFGLVGIMAYEKGTFVFFDGSKSEFRKVLKQSDAIAGYTISEIGSGSIKLSKNGQTVELPVGSQMRREEQGDWTLSKQPQTFAASAAPGSAATSAPSSTVGAAPSGPPGAADEVLKRLMQRREQE